MTKMTDLDLASVCGGYDRLRCIRDTTLGAGGGAALGVMSADATRFPKTFTALSAWTGAKLAHDLSPNCR